MQNSKFSPNIRILSVACSGSPLCITTTSLLKVHPKARGKGRGAWTWLILFGYEYVVGYLEESSEFAFSTKARNFFTSWEELVASKTDVYSKCLLKCCPLGCIFYVGTVPTKLAVSLINLLTPNYSGRTAPLTSKRSILYIYSTNIGTEYFKHGIYVPFFPLQNAACFINLTYLVPVLFTFYIQVC